MKTLNKENNDLMSNEKFHKSTSRNRKNNDEDDVRSSLDDLLSSLKAGHF